MTHKRDFNFTKSQTEIEKENLEWRLEKTEESRDYWKQKVELLNKELKRCHNALLEHRFDKFSNSEIWKRIADALASELES